MLDLMKVALVVTAFFIVRPVIIGFYDSEGLVDTKYNQVIPSTYGYIEYVGNGIYLASENVQRDRRARPRRVLFNKNGKLLRFKLPEDSWLWNVHWPGRQASQDSKFEVEELPSDAILAYVQGQDEIGLCDIGGNVLVPASSYDCRGESVDGLTIISKRRYIPGDKFDNPAYLFDCITRKFKRLPGISMSDFPSNFQFSEGLAPYRKDGKSLYGYINTKGTYVIKPQYRVAGPFTGGTARVLLSDPQDCAMNATIDKAGKVISPSNLEVLSFFGEHAVACSANQNPPMFGVVDRSFRFFFQPKYAYLLPRFFTTKYGGVHGLRQTPDFYIGREDDHQVILSASGQRLCELPPGYYFQRVLRDRNLEFAVKSTNEEARSTVVLSLNGERVPCQNFTQVGDERVKFYPVAEDRLIKVVTDDNGKFDAKYWRNGCDYPVSRYEMFARFLKEHKIISMPRSELHEYLGQCATDKFASIIGRYHPSIIEAIEKFPSCETYILRPNSRLSCSVDAVQEDDSLSLHIHFNIAGEVAGWYLSHGPLAEFVDENLAELPPEPERCAPMNFRPLIECDVDSLLGREKKPGKQTPER